MPAVLDADLTHLKGVGPKLAEAGGELGLENLGDLLRHIPHGFRDAASPLGLGALKLGEEATVEVKVLTQAKVRPTRRRGLRILEAQVGDESGVATATWFNRGWLADRLAPGTRLLLRGKLTNYGFTVSEHEILDGGDGAPAGLHTKGMVPIHSASEKLRPQRLREWAWQAMTVARNAVEPLPSSVRSALGMPVASDALVASHFPESAAQFVSARRRLAFEELVLHQASLASRRVRRREGRSAAPLPSAGEAVGAWLDSLPFELTGDQLAAIDEIDADLEAEAPMQRLLMGEVGSGKTVCGSVRDAARDRGRVAGGTDGADRDAGRAALPHARVTARVGRRRRLRCSPARPRRPSAAPTCSAWRRVSRASPSAPTL